MVQSRMLIPSSIALVFSWVAGVSASDGVIELSQTCAVQSGCLAGDTPGWPITINQAGSYILTSNLDLTGEPAFPGAIDSLVEQVSIDLNGFQIIGPYTCTGSGLTLSCDGPPPPGGGTGINGPVRAVRNGTIRGFQSYGIYLANGSVDGVRLMWNGTGMSLGIYTVVRNCLAVQNRGNGLSVDRTSVSGVVAFGNELSGLLGQGSISEVVASGNASGITANYGGVVSKAAANLNTTVGFDLNEGALLDSAASRNGGFGANFFSVGKYAGFAGNVFTLNNGGDANPQISSSGISLGTTNMCATTIGCP